MLRIDDLGPDVGLVDREHAGWWRSGLFFPYRRSGSLSSAFVGTPSYRAMKPALAACEFERQMEGPIEIIARRADRL